MNDANSTDSTMINSFFTWYNEKLSSGHDPKNQSTDNQ